MAPSIAHLTTRACRRCFGTGRQSVLIGEDTTSIIRLLIDGGNSPARSETRRVGAAVACHAHVCPDRASAGLPECVSGHQCALEHRGRRGVAAQHAAQTGKNADGRDRPAVRSTCLLHATGSSATLMQPCCRSSNAYRHRSHSSTAHTFSARPTRSQEPSRRRSISSGITARWLQFSMLMPTFLFIAAPIGKKRSVGR